MFGARRVAQLALLALLSLSLVVAPAIAAGQASLADAGRSATLATPTPTPPEETSTPPEDTPTPPEETPTPPEETPTPPEDMTPPDDFTPPERTPPEGMTPPGDRTPPEDMTPPDRMRAGTVTVQNLECVANCSGVQTDKIRARAIFGEMDGVANVNVQLRTAGGQMDLAAVGATPDTRFRIDLKIQPDNGTFTPQTLVVIGSYGRYVSQSAGDPATVTVAFSPTAGAINRNVRARSPEQWPDRNVTATRQERAVAILNIAEVGDSGYDELKGVSLATNAQVFAPPSYRPPGEDGAPAIRIEIAAPHYKTDGETLNTGHFRAFLPDSLLAEWNVTDPGQLTASVPGNSGTISISTVEGGVLVELTGYHYSVSTVTVTTDGAASSADGGSADGGSTDGGNGPIPGGSGPGFSLVLTLVAVAAALVALRDRS